jgi:phospholipase C
LSLRNVSSASQVVLVRGLHDAPHRHVLEPHAEASVEVDPMAKHHGWYDLVVSLEGEAAYQRRFAGHLENGHPSRTEPQQGEQRQAHED